MAVGSVPPVFAVAATLYKSKCHVSGRRSIRHVFFEHYYFRWCPRPASFVPAAALTLMDEMKQSMPCDETTFSAMMHGCAQTRDWDTAGRLLEEMNSAGLKPNDACYYTLLVAACRAGELRLAEGLIEGMRADGAAPDLYSYTTLSAACGRFHDWRMALRLIESMKLDGIPVTKKIYSASLAACGRGEAEIAEILLEMMRSQGVELDDVGRAHALVAFGRGSRPDKALALMDDIRENGSPPNRE